MESIKASLSIVKIGEKKAFSIGFTVPEEVLKESSLKGAIEFILKNMIMGS